MRDQHDRQNRTSFLLALATLALVAYALWGPHPWADGGVDRERGVDAGSYRTNASDGADPAASDALDAGATRTAVPRPEPTAEPTVSPTPTAEPVTPTPVPTTVPNTATPTSVIIVVPTVAPAAPVFAGSAEQWRPLVAEVFPAFAVDTVLRIMECESGGDPNETGLAGERGLMQIHPVHGALSTYDPAGNIHSAYVLSSAGTDWSPWTCW